MDSQANLHMICIHLKKSKCDQFGSGSDIMRTPLSTQDEGLTSLYFPKTMKGKTVNHVFMGYR